MAVGVLADKTDAQQQRLGGQRIQASVESDTDDNPVGVFVVAVESVEIPIVRKMPDDREITCFVQVS